MTPFLIILYMAITSRMAGGGLGAKYLDRFKITWLPEAFFALPLGYAGAHGIGQLTGADFAPPIAFVLCAAWSYIWMQTGHGTVLHWGKDPSIATGARTQFLTPLVNRIARTLELPVGGVGYCRLFMAVKGFLIGLPAGGLPLAILWPLGYEIGERFNSHTVKEFVAGAGAGIAVVAALYMT